MRIAGVQVEDLLVVRWSAKKRVEMNILDSGRML